MVYTQLFSAVRVKLNTVWKIPKNSRLSIWIPSHVDIATSFYVFDAVQIQGQAFYHRLAII